MKKDANLGSWKAGLNLTAHERANSKDEHLLTVS